MEIGAVARGADELAVAFVASAETAASRAQAVERHYAVVLERRVRNRASGAPGPEVRTGRYLDSIGRRGSSVGSDHPAARRLEVGFAGTDSRGRRFHQRPRPHFGPEAGAIADPFAVAAGAAVLPR